MLTTLTLPELGENVESADVTSVLVAVGDRVDLDQPVIEVETEKAVAEVPSTVTGVVVEVLVAPGDALAAGAPIVRVEAEEDGAGVEQAETPEPAPEPVAEAQAGATPEATRTGRKPVGRRCPGTSEGIRRCESQHCRGIPDL